MSGQNNTFSQHTYETFIAAHYRDLGCDVIEYDANKGLKDAGIDIIARMGDEIYFIKCIDLYINHTYHVDDEEIDAFQKAVNHFLDQNRHLKQYITHLRYTLSGDFLPQASQKRIEAHEGNVSYETVEPPYRKEARLRREMQKKSSGHTMIGVSTKIVLVLSAILAVLFMFLPKEKSIEEEEKKSKKAKVSKKYIPSVKQREKKETLPVISISDGQETEHILPKHKTDTTEKTFTVRKKPATQPAKAAEREDAKAKLLMQMQN